MRVDTLFELEDEALSGAHIAHVVRKVLADVDGAAMEPSEGAGAGLAFHVGVPEWVVRDAGDRPQRPPDEQGRYWCVIHFEPGAEGRPATLGMRQCEADQDQIPYGALEVVERVAEMLGARPVRA